MNRRMKFSIVAVLAMVVTLSGIQVAAAQDDTVPEPFDILLEPTSIVIIIGASAIGGLQRMLIPYGRKLRDYHKAREGGDTNAVKPTFQWSFVIAWVLAIPTAAIAAVLYAMASGVSMEPWVLFVNAFTWGLNANWYLSEATT